MDSVGVVCVCRIVGFVLIVWISLSLEVLILRSSVVCE